ncbi:hypothetical protein F443_20580 [Phytophthora nicotianae P1569]|uniref:Uncharacterized protein n=1 Tax=Phytophthora nicotianae P1569 TaxID=1317065 RepID=V9E0P4_PHYNI|nr:hypothetical protein F443_20580 [Phytophthora nicotianae P1569]
MIHDRLSLFTWSACRYQHHGTHLADVSRLAVGASERSDEQM